MHKSGDDDQYVEEVVAVAEEIESVWAALLREMSCIERSSDCVDESTEKPRAYVKMMDVLWLNYQ